MERGGGPTMSHMRQRWLLEFDNDGDCYTVPTDETTLAQAEALLRELDGERRWYCALFDDDDEQCMWCYGEPERRLIEVRLWGTPGDPTHFVVARDEPEGPKAVHVRYESESSSILHVPSREVLTASESLQIFRTWFLTKQVHHAFLRVPRRYLYD